ncbi:hypothetical protein Hte_006972 [Hypoxylon texense]
MAPPSLDTQVSVVSAAAQTFVDHYYELLSRPRARGGGGGGGHGHGPSSSSPSSLSPFYASSSPRLAAAGLAPDIVVNGRPCASVAEFESLLEAQGHPAAYEVRSFDAQPVNPAFATTTGAAAAAPGAAASAEKGDLVSFALQVSGVVRLGRGHVSRGENGEAPGAASGGGGAVVPVAPGGNVFGPGKGEDTGPIEKQFNEAFLLVPHWEAWVAKNPPRNMRKWVILSQNYRTL